MRLSYSVEFGLPTDFAERLAKIPAPVWTPAYNSDGEIREGAWVAEVTGLLNLDSWPTGMRVIARKERSTPPRSPATHHRRRRHAGHRVRHQHHPRRTRPRVWSPRSVS
jgi:hypothetical protein